MERDDVDNYVRKLIDNFNSHAHVERDWNTRTVGVKLEISTHTLTWSVTRYAIGKIKEYIISTHTLTWSVTAKLH